MLFDLNIEWKKYGQKGSKKIQNILKNTQL